MDIASTVSLLMELDKLKSVYRRAYVTKEDRHENSAEHSWHLAIACWVLTRQLEIEIDVEHMLKMAIVHDIGEIDPGDISIFSKDRAAKSSEEAACIERIAAISPIIQSDLKELWQEYEDNKSVESRWVKVADRLLPFLMNISTEGKTWREQGISRHQVLEINQVMSELHPELYKWLCLRIDDAVTQGWLEE
jgi:putative hydrolase of HD superfamily